VTKLILIKGTPILYQSLNCAPVTTVFTRKFQLLYLQRFRCTCRWDGEGGILINCSNNFCWWCANVYRQSHLIVSFRDKFGFRTKFSEDYLKKQWQSNRTIKIYKNWINNFNLSPNTCFSDVCLSVHLCICVEKNNQLDVTVGFIALMIRSTCFGHFYAHHQEL